MATLNELIEQYGANAFILSDRGNDSAYGEQGLAVTYDDVAMQQYGDVEMRECRSGVSSDGVAFNFESDWIAQSELNQSYEVKIFF